MKTNLNNIWQKCSWQNLQQNYMRQLSDLFAENRYYKFQDEIQFFHITTMEYWNIAIQKAFVVAVGIFLILHRITCITGLCWCHGAILFLPSLTYLSWWAPAPNARCLVTDDTFTAFSDNDRRRCRSVAQTSTLLRGNEWTLLRTFALILWLNLPNLGWLISWYLDISLCYFVLHVLTNCIIIFSVLLCIIFMDMFYCVTKGI